MNLVISILEFLAMLSVLVVIHELGHFITARLFKVKIEEFGVGYPPKIRTLFKWKGIPFTLNLIPVGGFVKMEGETSTNDQLSISNDHHGFGPFYLKPKWQRLIIILAGASVNFLFGVLLFTVIYSHLGIPSAVTPTQVIVDALGDGPGKAAGLLVDDQILQASDSAGTIVKATGVVEFTTWVKSKPDANIVLTVKRTDAIKQIKIHTRSAEDIKNGLGAISVSLAEPLEFKFYPWYRMPFEASKFGLQRSVEFSKLILESLGQMGGDLFKKGKVPTDVAGPIGIVREVDKQKVFGAGWSRALDFTAMFSINLAIMNVLPIPALDGGRAFFILIEYFVGRKRIARIEDNANAIGIVMLLLIIFLISVKDIWMIFR